MKIVSVTPLFNKDKNSIFNVAAWLKPNSENVILIGRSLSQKGTWGQPDIGKLVLWELGKNNQVLEERIIWEPKFDSILFEDPRAFVLEDGRIMIGLTAVLKTRGRPQTFPSLVWVDKAWNSLLPPVTIIQTFGHGKNMTPVASDYFAFRPENPYYNHKLLFFKYQHPLVTGVDTLSFPLDIPWGLWKMGTGAPPIWLNKEHAIFTVHGINLEKAKYVYTIGISLLRKKGKNFSIDVYPEPLLTKDILKNKIKITELRPRKRNVLYVCGGLVKPDEPNYLYLYVNVGDLATYEVVFDFVDLKRLFGL